MDDFKREHRYWVIKRKHLTPEQDEACRQLCGRLRYEGVPEVETVSVESDWAIYEDVWDMVQRLAEGRPQQLDELAAQLDKAERIADREATGFRAMCEAFERLEEIAGLDTGGGLGPGPALSSVERLMRERDALAAQLEQEREVSERLMTDLNDINGPASMGEPVLPTKPTPAEDDPSDGA